jgi:antitoxin YefM
MTALDVINYTTLRQNLAKVMDDVCDSSSYVIVTRQNARPVVMMSYEEYRGIEETLYLLRSPTNAERLMESIADANAGRLEQHDLIETDDDIETKPAA